MIVSGAIAAKRKIITFSCIIRPCLFIQSFYYCVHSGFFFFFFFFFFYLFIHLCIIFLCQFPLHIHPIIPFSMTQYIYLFIYLYLLDSENNM